MRNAEIARRLTTLADLLEIDGANGFRVRAYRQAALAVENQPRQIADMLEAGEDLTDIEGIGEDLADKLATLVRDGRLPGLGDAEKRVPPALRDLLRIDQLGPKRVKALYDELGIQDLDDLRRAARNDEIRRLSGFGEKSQDKILDALERLDSEERRTPLHEAQQVAEPLVEYLRETDGVSRVTIAGSYRRRKATVGDLDILAVCDDSRAIMQRFTGHEEVDEVISRGKTRSSVRLGNGLQIDLRVVPAASYGAALYYFTGSKAHNVAVRRIAVDKGLKINEYGVSQGDEHLAGEDEEAVFAQVGLPFIPPELRENTGEIDAAYHDRLPRLITLDDIRGDLHMHTRDTDGRASLEEMADAGKRRGHAYIAITDHSQRLRMTHGLDSRRLREQMAAIDALNERIKGIRVLKSLEVDILEDGSLDLPDEVLDALDLCVASVHSRFELSREKQTERLLRAMDNPRVHIIGHPTGRIINRRDAYPLDLERLIDGARERDCCLELNAQPSRLDLGDRYARQAKEAGVTLAISTDAHATGQLGNMPYGIDQARRGWLEPDDVLNTRTLAQLQKRLKRR
ncbi:MULTISPECIES: DNA polymerase/3'-5' exonuclease PolX [unclassified Modicisalibacter]|uniref:DNA polymerase/3'-5' exonuclease PolX n=1 Tax=unclassified Modicisalibacter TaxID=2679913 RepID=UPI001CCC3CE3|nr:MULTISPECIES: DNA polymerase/3'-5' exonuclease PolX [unclassified Modicisalibacter]MBZ9556536.1 DNA polymerase/3'-5' exonuclease PolX [Modicisalibacter sp. R2A 31.J]MBZ9574995.1 DNA polymerase/3'-5' exonuclease PolX [Modicisalibacter sp. MOD 31.J]